MPTQGASTAHLGQDLGAADGSPIYSVAAGTVVRAFSGNRYNTGFVVVQHQINGRTFHSAYLHMWDAHTHVRVGQTVQAGQTISRVGSSGASTGPHLHLEIWEGAWMHGTSHNPTTWLAQRGVDLRASASFVMNITNPSACNYWTVNSTPLRATASSTGSVIMQLGAGATLTAAPGDTSNGMVRVNANGRIGWVAHSSLTPSRPAGGGTVPVANVPQGTSITPTQYRTTAALNGRSGPGTNYAVLQGLTSGTTVTVTATHGGWMKFSRNGQSVWSHSDFLTRVTAPAPASPTVSGVASASGSYTVKSGGPLNVRVAPGTSNAIAGHRACSGKSYRLGRRVGQRQLHGQVRGAAERARRAGHLERDREDSRAGHHGDGQWKEGLLASVQGWFAQPLGVPELRGQGHRACSGKSYRLGRRVGQRQLHGQVRGAAERARRAGHLERDREDSRAGHHGDGQWKEGLLASVQGWFAQPLGVPELRGQGRCPYRLRVRLRNHLRRPRVLQLNARDCERQLHGQERCEPQRSDRRQRHQLQREGSPRGDEDLDHRQEW
nr:peptidoglycan DD-metalloendopeptidase family protein [Nesterenkonia sp. LB17]